MPFCHKHARNLPVFSCIRLVAGRNLLAMHQSERNKPSGIKDFVDGIQLFSSYMISIHYVAQEGDAGSEPPARSGRSLKSSPRQSAHAARTILHLGNYGKCRVSFVLLASGMVAFNARSASAGLLQRGVGRICQDPRRSWQQRDVTSSCTCLSHQHRFYSDAYIE